MNADLKEGELPPVRTVALGAAAPADSSRPTIVLLHGWRKSLEALRPLGELLVDHGPVLLLDLPGFGASPLPHAASNAGGGWGTQEYADRVKQVLDAAGIGSCVLIGHSFGGRISVRLAAKYPEMVKGVVLIGSHGIPRERTLSQKLRIRAISAAVKASKRFDALFRTKLFETYVAPRVGSADYLAAGDMRRTMVKTVNENLTSLAQNITSPTLLLWGANDTETPVDIARAYSRLIKGSELHVFPNKGHEPYADVGSHLLATYIGRFFNDSKVCV